MLRWAFAGLLTLAALFVFVGEAEAATANPGATCSNAIENGAGSGYYATRVATVGTSGNLCVGGVGTLQVVPAGASLTLECKGIQAGGGVPPLPADSVTIRGYDDNAAFGSPGTAGIWSQAYTNCDTTQTFTVWCTDTGGSGGNPRYGLVRLMVRHQLTAVYDENSDSGMDGNGGGPFYGHYYCSAHADTVTDGNTGASPSAYAPPDTYRTTFNVSKGQAYSTSPSSFTATLTCGASVVSLGSFTGSTSATTIDTILKGTFATWPDDCLLTQKFSASRMSALTGYSAMPYARFETANPCSGCVVTTSLVTRDTKTLDRTYTASSCTQTVGGTARDVVNRAVAVDFACVWKNVRNEDVATSVCARSYVLRSGQAWRDTTDFVSTDAAFTSGGSLSYSAASRTTATDTAGGALDYKRQMEAFAACSRSDSELWGVGNTTNTLDVSASWTFDAIRISKTSGGANTSVFLIGPDIEFAKALGLRDANGVAISGQAVSCQRTKPDTSLETPATNMGTTSGSGDSPEASFAVVAPAGTWKLTCTASANGNSASYVITFTHTSPYSADFVVAVRWNVTLLANGSYLANVSTVFRSYDPTTDTLIAALADEAPRLHVQRFDASTGRYSAQTVERVSMTLTGGAASAAYYHNFYPSQADLFDAFAFVRANLTGRVFVGSEGFQLANSTSGSSGNFTIAEEDELRAMAAFFASDSVVLAPYVMWLLAGVILPLILRGFLPNVVVFIFNAIGLFLIVDAKTSLDALGWGYTWMLGITSLGLLLFQLVWLIYQANRFGMATPMMDGSE